MKNEQMRDLLCAFLDCGYLDLEVFDGCEYDFADLIENCKLNFGKITFGGLFFAMVEKGLSELQDAINDRIAEMKADDELPDEVAENNFDVFDDIEYYCNYLDSGVYFHNNGELYEKYFKKELYKFEDNTGYAIY